MKKLSARSDCDMEWITLHMDATTKALLQRAADVSGLSSAEFIQDSAKVQAQRLLSQSVVTRVSTRTSAGCSTPLKTRLHPPTIRLRH